jgi:tetratricopeptide (TPR) repeat protein
MHDPISQSFRSPLSNQAIGAILHPASVALINGLIHPNTVSIDRAEELLDPARISFIAVHLAKKYFHGQRYDQTILWLEVALENGHPNKAIILGNIAMSYIGLELWEKALEFFISSQDEEYAHEASQDLDQASQDLRYAHDTKIKEYITALQKKIYTPNPDLKYNLNDSGVDDSMIDDSMIDDSMIDDTMIDDTMIDDSMIDDTAESAQYYYDRGKEHARLRNWEDAINSFKKARALALQELGLEQSSTSLGSESDTSTFSGNDSGIFEASGGSESISVNS